MKKSITLFTLALMVYACGENKKAETETENEVEEAMALDEVIIGTWTNLTLNVTMKGEETDSVINVPEGSWEEVLGIKPIVTDIKKDGTFISTYYTLENEVMMTNEGSWEVKGDSLVMVQDGQATTYHTMIKDNVATFTGYLDWDQDADADDLYIGTQRKKED